MPRTPLNIPGPCHRSGEREEHWPTAHLQFTKVVDRFTNKASSGEHVWAKKWPKSSWKRSPRLA